MIPHQTGFPAIVYSDASTGQPTYSLPTEKILRLTTVPLIVDFIVNLSTTFPVSEPLLPATPKSLAKMNLFIESLNSDFISTWNAVITNSSDSTERLRRGPTAILPPIEALQALLPSDGYAVGQWSIADAIAAPFLAQVVHSLKNDRLGFNTSRYESGSGIKVWEVIRENDKYARFKKYYVDLTSRESFKQTIHFEVSVAVK